MNIEKILIIGKGNKLGISVANHLEQLKKDFGENILIVEDDAIVYPTNVSIDDVIHLANEHLPVNDLMKMVQDLQMNKEVDRFIDQIRKSAMDIPVMPQSYAIHEETKSNFIPTRGGDKSGRGNKRIVRR